MDKVRIIKIQCGMSDPKGKLIPRGVQERLTVEVADEVATYYFKDQRVTKNFSTIEIEGDKARGLEPTTLFISRLGKAIKKYPGKTKEEIRDEVLQQLKELNANAVRVRDG